MLPAFDLHFYEDLLNNLTDGIYLSDGNGITLWVNKASAAMCHLSPEELIGRSVWELEQKGIFNPSATRLALESGKTVSIVQSMQNGRKFLVTGHLIHNQNGGVETVVCQSRDITEAVRTTSQIEETEILLRRYSQEIMAMKMQSKKEEPTRSLVGSSKVYKNLLALVEKVSEVDTTVLITGETGVGKSAVARRIHQLSPRHDKPFLQINCGAIPESLIESELFGYKRGAFSGANTEGKSGLVKIAEKGTLFLDEIGELPLHLQTKILQLLQDKTYIPIGDTQVQTANVRIIAATNRNLVEMIEEKKFRADLYYRLNILSIQVPALRDRQEDLIQLVYYYLNKYNEHYGKSRSIPSKIFQILQNYDWPGNIRELENLVERFVITAAKDEICLEDLPEKIRYGKITDAEPYMMMPGETLTEFVERMEKEIIEQTYQRHNSTRKVSKALGITQSSIMRRLKKYQIQVDLQD
jgi:PAS domain S-box-containing protein/TyrR family helix-turn-helix protein